MATYTVINATEAALTNVDGSSTNVDAMSYKNGITLDSTHLASLLDGSTFGKAICVVTDLTSVTWAERLKRALAIAGLYLSS